MVIFSERASKPLGGEGTFLLNKSVKMNSVYYLV